MKIMFSTLVLFILNSASAQFVPITMWKKKEGMGYFVLSFSGNGGGNYGGLAGADTFCLDELQTLTWKGKAQAGTLTASRVKAFLCIDSHCVNPLPNTTYAFARANSTTIGGATFTTDATGQGPHDTLAWDGPNHFGSNPPYYWIGNRPNTNNTSWGTVQRGLGGNCNNWTSASMAVGGYGGNPTYGTSYRWNDDVEAACSENYAVICIVNP